MENVRFQVLSKLADIEAYQQETLRKVHVQLPMEYLERSVVVGLKDEKTAKIYGGFTMAYQGPLRCLEQLPSWVLRTNPHVLKHKESCFEINGLWLNRQLAPDGSRFKLYLHCMKQASLLSFQGKHKYVYAYGAENIKLKKFYNNFHSKKIYEGPVRLLPGMQETGPECVEMGCMKKLPVTVLRNPQFLLSRAFNEKTRNLSWIKRKWV